MTRKREQVSDLIPSQVRDLMQRTNDPIVIRSLAKLYDALVTDDDLLRIQAEDELEGVRLDLVGLS